MKARTSIGVHGVGDFADKPSDAQFAAIGKLVNSFAEIDATLASLLMDIIDLPYEVSLEFKGDGRNSTTAALLKKIIQAKYNTHKYATYIHLILEDINKVRPIRDAVAHAVCAADGDRLIFSYTKTDKRIDSRYMVISTDELLELERFCRSIVSAIGLISPRFPETGDPEWDRIRTDALRSLNEKPRAAASRYIRNLSICRKQPHLPKSYPQ